MAVFAYVRVSTDRQADEGESLGAQERKIAGYALMQGLAVDRVFIERGVSGSIPLAERPQGAKLLDSAKTDDVVITAKLDRMFRSAVDALNVGERFKATGIALHMIDLGGDVTGNGISKLVFTILSAVAEAERDRIRERVRDVKRDQRSRKRYLGGAVPFGYRVSEDGELDQHGDEQIAIREMQRLRGEGESLRTISSRVLARGHRLTHAGVAKVLAAHPVTDCVA